MAFISYAQNYEDVMLWRALRDVEQGFYVDVGAADPEMDSVTHAFYERGWSGINLEPLDEYFERLQQARPRDTNLRVAGGREDGLRTLHAVSGTGLSTFDPQIGARHRAAGFETHQTIIPVLPLTKILEDCAPPTIHFLKIDVEGAEAEVLEGLDLSRVRPWIIVIEATEPNSTEISRDRWEHLITDHGYDFVYFDGLNCFYVADEVSGLRERFRAPPNFFDEFIRRSEWFLEQELAGLKGRAAGLEAALGVTTSQAERTQAALARVQEALQAEQAHGVALREALQAEQAHGTALHEALRAEQAHGARLHEALQLEQARNAELRGTLAAEQAHAAAWREALKAEQVQSAELQRAFQAQQAQLDVLLASVRRFGDELIERSAGNALQRSFQRLRATGDQLTGGGARALGQRVWVTSVRRAGPLVMGYAPTAALARGIFRPFPDIATYLYRLANPEEGTSALAKGVPTPAVPTEVIAAPSPADNASPADTLPATARMIYFRLKAAMAESATGVEIR